MVKMRHLKHDTLAGLEQMVGEVKLPITILGPPQRVKNSWYVHFLIQGNQEEKKPVKKVERAKKTKTIKRS